MKKIIFIFSFFIVIIGCNKNTSTTNNEPTHEVHNKTNGVVQNPASVESAQEDKTEERWLALIEKEVTEISFKNGEYKIIPTDKEDYFEIYTELENGLRFYAILMQKNFEDDPRALAGPEMMQKYAKVVLSASTLPQYLQKERGVFETNGYKFKRTIKVTEFAPDIVFFRLSYYTTTPMYMLRCTFSRDAEEFKEEAPQYFDENGEWKLEMPSGETGYSEFVQKIADGTIESKTARELYKISEDFMNTIEIKTHEPTDEVQNETNGVVQNPASVESAQEDKTEERWLALIEKEVTEISFKNGEYTIIPTEQKESYIYGKLKNGLRFYVQLIPKDYINDSIQFVRPETFQEYAKAVLSASTLPKDLQKKRGVFEINGYTFGHGIWLTRFDPSITLFQSSYYTTTPTYTLECTFFRSLCEEFKEEAPQYFDENGDWKQKMPSGEAGDNEFAQKIVDGTIESKTARELYKISEDFMKTIEIITVE